MYVILNGHKYTCGMSFADDRQLKLDLVLYYINSIDTVRIDAIRHEGDISIYNDDGSLVYTYVGYDQYNHLYANGSLEIYMDRKFNYADSLVILTGKLLSIVETLGYRNSLTRMCQYAPDDLAKENKWAFDEWRTGKAYRTNDKVNYGDGFYKAKKNHVSNEKNNPTTDLTCWQLLE